MKIQFPLKAKKDGITLEAALQYEGLYISKFTELPVDYYTPCP
ncbi:hypothetical protein [Mesobacillus foraminis]|nr:hypothetical protein [Mesobacillus foraminis]